jgi:hypothetical protein|tara:strand:- start:1782 stop:2018 length:237 start_codon:yes stop_codon:yes gene_type:complete
MYEILIGLILTHDIKYFLDDMISIEIIAAFFDPVLVIELLHHQHLLFLLKLFEGCLDDSATLLVQRVINNAPLYFFEY